MPIRLVKNSTPSAEINYLHQKNQKALLEELKNKKLLPKIIIIEDHESLPEIIQRKENISASHKTYFKKQIHSDENFIKENSAEKRNKEKQKTHFLQEEKETIFSPQNKNFKPKSKSFQKIKNDISDKPLIAIVIDDMGINHDRTAQISRLKYPLTASFLTYGTKLDTQIKNSKNSGHEIIAHLPMQPYSNIDIAPDVLTVNMTLEQVRQGLNIMLDKFDGIVGVNNHMGSRFTEDKKRMNVVMQELKKRNLFFLDSKTTAHSVGKETAYKNKVDYVSRNIFLDNKDQFDYIMQQLIRTEKIAKKNGYAIAIGHPKKQTYNALKVWLPTLEKKGVKLVFLSQIVEKTNPHK